MIQHTVIIMILIMVMHINAVVGHLATTTATTTIPPLATTRTPEIEIESILLNRVVNNRSTIPMMVEVLDRASNINNGSAPVMDDPNDDDRNRTDLRHNRELFFPKWKHLNDQLYSQLLLPPQVLVHQRNPITVMQPVPMTTQRIQVKRIIQEKNCPIGMELRDEGDACVGTSSFPSIRICPPTMLMASNGDCIATARPRVECPVGFDLKVAHGLRLGVKLYHHCVSCEVFPAQFTCRDPTVETLDASSGMCLSSTSQSPTCLPGFTIVNNNECIQVVPTELQCRVGDLSRATGRCVQTRRTPASPVCPEDGAYLHPHSQMCVSLQPVPPHCGEGFTFDSSSSACIRFVPPVPLPCPLGFTRVGVACEQVNHFPAERYCPDTYVMDQRDTAAWYCLKQIPLAPRCPSGFQLTLGASNTALCEAVVSPTLTCPDGELVNVGLGKDHPLLQLLHPDRPQCQSMVVHNSIQCCPAGFSILNSRCHRIETLVPMLSCNADCYVVHRSPLQYMCPVDAEFMYHPETGPTCIRKTLSSCTITQETGPAALRHCHEKKDNVHALPHGPATEPRELRGQLSVSDGTSINRVDPTCVSVSDSPVLCHDKSLVKEETFKAEAFCPKGELDGDACVIRTLLIPKKTCRVGQLDETTGQCIREIVIPVKTDCPAGTIRQSQGCISLLHTEPVPICPDGSQPSSTGLCITTATPLMETQTIRAGPAYGCNVGQLSATNDCVDVVRIPQELSCPVEAAAVEGNPSSSRTPGGNPSSGMDTSSVVRCVITSPLLTPPPLEVQRHPNFVCPDNSLAWAYHDCESIETFDPVSSCPPGTISNTETPEDDARSQRCIRRSPVIPLPPITVTSRAVVVCPPDADVRGASCIRHRKAEPIMSCPSNFVHDPVEQRCVRSSPPTACCPALTTLVDNSCLHHTYARPTVTVVQGCSYELLPDRCTECSTPVRANCHG